MWLSGITRNFSEGRGVSSGELTSDCPCSGDWAEDLRDIVLLNAQTVTD
jgi:hypothetical protein